MEGLLMVVVGVVEGVVGRQAGGVIQGGGGGGWGWLFVPGG